MILRRKLALKLRQISALTLPMCFEREFTRLSPELAKIHRAEFNRVKDELIGQWERNTGQIWPRYTEDILAKNGVTVARKAGGPLTLIILLKVVMAGQISGGICTQHVFLTSIKVAFTGLEELSVKFFPANN